MASAGFRITGTTKLFHTHTGQFNCPGPPKNVKTTYSQGGFFVSEILNKVLYL